MMPYLLETTDGQIGVRNRGTRSPKHLRAMATLIEHSPRADPARPLAARSPQLANAAARAMALRLRCTLIAAVSAAGVAWYSSSNSRSSGVTGVVAMSR
jgi:hypothetical protein